MSDNITSSTLNNCLINEILTSNNHIIPKNRLAEKVRVEERVKIQCNGLSNVPVNPIIHLSSDLLHKHSLCSLSPVNPQPVSSPPE